MLNKIMKICFAGLIISLIALISISVFMHMRNEKDLYLIVPRNTGGQGIDIKEIEKINEDAFMLTYVRKQQNTATTGYTKHDITLVSTNYTFPFVCRYQMINGGFFTRENQEGENNYAVLNETAAFNMFGNMNVIGLEFTINDKEYIIKGIINDTSQVLNVYLPMQLTEQNPDSFMIKTDEFKGVSREYILTKLKQTGISDMNYYFTNIGLLNEKITGKAFVAVLLLVGFCLVFVLLRCLKILKLQSNFLALAYKKLYLRDLLRTHPQKVIAFIGNIAAVFSIVAMFVLIILCYMNMYLLWNEAGALPVAMALNFEDKYIFIQKTGEYTNLIFVAFLAFLMSFFACFRGQRQL